MKTAGDATAKRFLAVHKGDDDDEFDLGALAGIAGIDTYLAGVAEDAGQNFLAQLKLPDASDMFDQVNDRAVAYAKARAAELVSGVDDATRNELKGIITDGLEENIGMDAIADRIREAYAFSEERADLIAKTEIGFANQAGALDGMKLAQKAGVKLMKVWVPDADACPICEENGDAGPIPLDEDFPSGDDAPLAHPSCECSLASEVEEESGAQDEEDGE